MANLDELEEKIMSKQEQVIKDHDQVQKAKTLSFDEIMQNEKSAFTVDTEASKEKLKESIQQSLESSSNTCTKKSS